MTTDDDKLVSLSEAGRLLKFDNNARVRLRSLLAPRETAKRGNTTRLVYRLGDVRVVLAQLREERRKKSPVNRGYTVLFGTRGKK